MKKFFKLVTLVAFVAGITWVLRDQLLPGPEAPTSHPPAFRHPPPTAEKSTATAVAPSGDDMTEVNGIGPVYAKKLSELGIDSFAALAAADAADVAARSDIARDRVADWINKAAELA